MVFECEGQKIIAFQCYYDLILLSTFTISCTSHGDNPYCKEAGKANKLIKGPKNKSKLRDFHFKFYVFC